MLLPMTNRTATDYLRAVNKILSDIDARRTTRTNGDVYFKNAETTALDIELVKALAAMAQAADS